MLYSRAQTPDTARLQQVSLQYNSLARDRMKASITTGALLLALFASSTAQEN
jgi:hypothetical protein